MMKRTLLVGSMSVLALALTADADAQPGGHGLRPRPPAPSASPSSAALPPDFFRPSSVDAPSNSSYTVQGDATLHCGVGYQLRTTNTTVNRVQVPGQSAYCAKTEDVVESKRPGCPSGWGYLIADTQFVPAAKAKFGKADQCFRSDSSSRKKEDLGNYTSPNCIIGPNGATGGFGLVVKDGEDACERTRQVDLWRKVGGGTAIATNAVTLDAFEKSLTVSCPGGTSLHVDLGERTVVAIPSGAWPANAGVFCKRDGGAP